MTYVSSFYHAFSGAQKVPSDLKLDRLLTRCCFLPSMASPPHRHWDTNTRVNAAAWGGRGCERSSGGFWFQNVSKFFYQKPFAKQENEPKPETVYRYSAWPATERWNGVYALELSSKIISKPKTKKTTNLSTDLWFVLPLLNLESTELRWFKPQRQII